MLIESHRSLISESEKTVKLDDIEAIVIEHFESRTWEEGKFESQERQSAAWLKLAGERLYPIASACQTTVESCAARFQTLLGIPLDTLPAEESPIAESWEAEPSD